MDAHFPSYCLGFPLWKVGLLPAWSPGVVERLTDNGCVKPGSPQAHKVPCSHSLLVDAALGQGDGVRAGFHGASTALVRDRDKVRHRCQLWALLYKSAEPEAILPALPIFIPKEGGGAQTYPGLPSHRRLVPHYQPTPHRVNGAVSPCQVQVHQSVGLGQETVQGLGREGRGVAGEGAIETQALQPERASAGAGGCVPWTHIGLVCGKQPRVLAQVQVSKGAGKGRVGPEGLAQRLEP